MSRRNKIITAVTASIAGLVLVAVIGSIVVMQTQWFRDYVRGKIISSVEESTGGKVEISAFTFDWHGFTARITGFVIHGTEPPGSPPLLEAPSVVLRLKLLAGLKQTVDLEYLGADQPRANVIVFPDGQTNIPAPKVTPQNTKLGLETIVDLAIHQVDISHGTIQFLQQTIPFSARGEDLRIALAFNRLGSRYQGEVSMSPLYLASGTRPPLNAKVTIPVQLEKDKIQVTNARIETSQSKFTVTGALQHLTSPEISGQLNAHIALEELTRSVDLPIHPRKGHGPQALDAQIAVRSGHNTVQIQNALVTLGRSQLEASGNLKNTAEFHGSLALDELGQLLRLAAQPAGTVQIAGQASLPESGYRISGTVDARDVSFRQGASRVSGIRLASNVRADPKTIEASDLKLFAWGGELQGDARIEDLSAFTLKGNLRGFSIQSLTAALAGKRLAYAGVISGTVEAQGNLKVGAGEGLVAHARLGIKPQGPGIPISGQVNATYNGRSGVISLANSQITLPSSRVDLTGEPGRQAEVRVVSRNLDDFLPAMTLVSPAIKEMPLRLKEGAATLTANVNGPLTAPRIAGHIAITSFAVGDRPFDQLASDFSASESGVSVQNGSLNRNGSQAQFSASVGLHHWNAEPRNPLTANATIRSGDLADILALAGHSDIRASGMLNADVRIAGTIGNPQGSAQFNVVNGTAFNEPFDQLQASVDLQDQLVNLKSMQLTAGAARIDLRGTFAHPRDSFETGKIQLHLTSNQVQLAQFKTLQKERPGLAGVINLNADLAGTLEQAAGQTEFTPSLVNADLKATGVKDQGQSYGDLTATARTSGSEVTARVDSDFAASTIRVTSRTLLAKGYPTTADATIRGLQIEKAIALARPANPIPATGTLSATAHASGTLDDPHVNTTFDLTKAKIYDEPLDRMAGTVEYTDKLVNVSSLQIASPAGRVDLKGSLAHAPSDFGNGHLQLHLSAPGVDLRRVQNVQKNKPGLAGALRVTADVIADLRQEKGEQLVLPSRFDVSGAVNKIEWNGQSFGDATFQGETKGNVLSVKLDSGFAGSAIHGAGDVRLQGDYPVGGKITFANVTYTGLSGFLGSEPRLRPTFDALVEGQAAFKGSAKKPKDMQVELQLAKFQLFTAPPGASRTAPKVISLQNQGPIVARMEHSLIRVESARLTGRSTAIAIGGTIALDKSSPLDLTVNANVDLSLLRDFSQDVFSEGSVVVNSAVRGTMSQPLLNGQIELQHASIQLVDLPNGMSNGNGVILLNGSSATIRSLTAESGGGKVTLTGFAGFTGSTLYYDIRANANHVRTRYSGASVVANAVINLSGNTDRSVLGGTVTIERVGYNQQSDFGSMLSGASSPPETPSAPAGLLAGMRLNIRIRTSPDVRFQTSLAQQLEATADLHLLGTTTNPGMVGRIDISGGTLIFFGNKYNVNRGSIAFYNASKIEPILDIDLETSVKSVDVVLGVSGPVENMKLTYRSDPPLKFDDIVALLATGRTPRDATIAARQPAAPEQSMTQMGESAILSQAVANPLSSRLERVFGVSQLKIDPTFNSGSALPTARVTLQQQVTPTLTFTYTQDLTQTNSQIIRVEWALSPRFSAVATRDENGFFGLDFYYKKQFR